jgi:phosphate transport system substrate-binding protein
MTLRRSLRGRSAVRPAAASVACGVLAVVGALQGAASASVGAAVSHAAIQGSGSSWSANAVTQWIADVTPSGLRVVYTPSGSAVGRKDFANKTTDFAVSDIGFLGRDPISGDLDTSNGRSFVYLPIVAGGTSFPYQIKVGGRQVRNLRLSGQTLAKIFTNRITNWNDPAITADNNGHALPSLPIIVVVHSEGSGSSAQFTKYLDKQYPSIWRPFLGQAGSTEYFPRKGRAIAQSGSDGVINFVTSKAANGAIGYDEYSYALGKNYPVAKLLNTAGYYTAPTQYNVAVALTKAQINYKTNDPTCPTGPANCYLLQNLDQVYVNKDPRTYAMSSYSYMIIPTAASDARMTTAKRQTLADFLYWSLCRGQAEMGPIGYSPLPINLVQASFDQTAKLKTADPNVDLTSRNVSTCHNPTFVAGQPNRNYLAEIAPQPPSCDKQGQGPCSGTANNVSNGNPQNGHAPSTAPSAGSTGGGTASGPTSPTASQPADPLTGDTGQPQSNQAGGEDLVGTPTEISANGPGSTTGLLAGLAVGEILLILVLPPILARYVWRRRTAAAAAAGGGSIAEAGAGGSGGGGPDSSSAGGAT